LWLSTDDDPGNIVLLASEPVWGSYDTFSHRADPVSLVGGQKYYIMARWKENVDWDHCQVAWQGAGIRDMQIIQGSYLSPYLPVTAYGPSPAKSATDVERTPILRWKPGTLATQHRVYLGTDPNAVRNASTSSPEYKGTKALGTESYDAGTLAFETTYYWRIDEVNSVNAASPWVGDVWSFTTGNFLVLDDFEGYTDDQGSRVFDVWIDGWGTQTNGSVVGYANPDFNAGEHHVETIIIHSGRQSMPFSYNDDMKYSEAVKTLSGADRDWTREGVDTLSLWFRGNPATVGIFVEEPNGTVTMRGSGTDIAGMADEFHFAYKKLTGAGSIIVQVLSVGNTNAWAKAAVMIRESLAPGSKHALVCVTPRSGVAFEGRTITDGDSFSFNEAAITAPHWVKLERSAVGEFTATHSADGVTWVPLQNVTSQLIWMESETVYIGLAVTSHDALATCEARFSNVTMTGAISPDPWKHHDVGILSNEAEPMYVVLNGTAVVYNEDPNAVLTNQWTEWRIPLQDFAAKGVSLTAVDSMGIGIGTPGNTTTPGGSGTMYFDDIRLDRPGQVAGQ